jgi:hypothetical protein
VETRLLKKRPSIYDPHGSEEPKITKEELLGILKDSALEATTTVIRDKHGKWMDEQTEGLWGEFRDLSLLEKAEATALAYVLLHVFPLELKKEFSLEYRGLGVFADTEAKAHFVSGKPDFSAKITRAGIKGKVQGCRMKIGVTDKPGLAWADLTAWTEEPGWGTTLGPSGFLEARAGLFSIAAESDMKLSEWSKVTAGLKGKWWSVEYERGGDMPTGGVFRVGLDVRF